MTSYSTSQIAKKAKLHPNTIRFYEEIKYLPPVSRKANGYRVFTDVHFEQLKLIKVAHRCGIVQNNLRKKAVEIILLCANSDYEEALIKAKDYQVLIGREKNRAEEAVLIVHNMLDHKVKDIPPQNLRRSEAAEFLDVTVDALRNWELNGLLEVPRKVNGYRVYTEKEIREFKIIRVLREANYSLMSILRMLNQLRSGTDIDLQRALDTPDIEDDIVYVTDRLLTSLTGAKEDTSEIIEHILQNGSVGEII